MTTFDQHRFTPEEPASSADSSRESTWGLIIVTMVLLAYGVWSGYQIHDLQKLRGEIQELRAEIDNHKVELSRLQVQLLEEAD